MRKIIGFVAVEGVVLCSGWWMQAVFPDASPWVLSGAIVLMGVIALLCFAPGFYIGLLPVPLEAPPEPLTVEERRTLLIERIRQVCTAIEFAEGMPIAGLAPEVNVLRAKLKKLGHEVPDYLCQNTPASLSEWRDYLQEKLEEL